MLLSMASCFNNQVPPDDLPADDSGNGGETNEPVVLLPAPLVNGVSLDSYVIVYDAEGLDYNKRAAEYIRDTVRTLTGHELAIVDDAEDKKANEIVVGETSRAISAELNADTEGFEFAILAKDGSVALEGDYFVISAAAYFFTANYVLSSGENALIPAGVSIHEPIVEEAKNYIVLIGDGMGVMQTQLFDYLEDSSEYSDGENLFYGYMFPYQGYARTSSFSGVTDSAAAGTALATGYKTYNKYVGVDKNGNAVKSLTELAAEIGKATAVMSTENKTGATPSTFSSHTLNRDNTTDILEHQTYLTSTYGTVIDCGYDYYTARYMKTIEKHVSDTLAKVDADEDGFFLMYEEAYIDKHSAKNDLENTYLALIRFNQVIARFMEYAFCNPDTAVIITADHETGGLHLTEDGTLAYTIDDHTAADVPVFAWGVNMECLDGKTVENIEIAKLIASLMGEDNFGDQSKDWYNEIYGEKTDDNGNSGSTPDDNGNNGNTSEDNTNNGNDTPEDEIPEDGELPPESFGPGIGSSDLPNHY